MLRWVVVSQRMGPDTWGCGVSWGGGMVRRSLSQVRGCRVWPLWFEAMGLWGQILFVTCGCSCGVPCLGLWVDLGLRGLGFDGLAAWLWGLGVSGGLDVHVCFGSPGLGVLAACDMGLLPDSRAGAGEGQRSD